MRSMKLKFRSNILVVRGSWQRKQLHERMHESAKVECRGVHKSAEQGRLDELEGGEGMVPNETSSYVHRVGHRFGRETK